MARDAAPVVGPPPGEVFGPTGASARRRAATDRSGGAPGSRVVSAASRASGIPALLEPGQRSAGGPGHQLDELDPPVVQRRGGHTEEGRQRTWHEAQARHGDAAPRLPWWATVSGPATSSSAPVHTRSMQPSGSTCCAPSAVAVAIQPHSASPASAAGARSSR